MTLRPLTPSDITNKTVLLRVDYNVPLQKKADGSIEIKDTKRIEDTLTTIEFLRHNNAKIVIIAHLGRPKDKDPSLSLESVANYLRDSCLLPAAFCPNCIGDEAKKCVNALNPGELILMENLRYFEEEENNDETFAKQLSELAEVYVNDAFSNSHRAHASMVGVTKFLPSFAGLTLQKEVETLSKLLNKPDKPFVVVLGGAKISDKVGAVEHLGNLADIILVGGAVANNFMKADGLEIYRSYVEDASSDTKKREIDYVAFAQDMLQEHKTEHMLKDGYIPLPKILYPIDVVATSGRSVSRSLESGQQTQKPKDPKTTIIDLTHDMQDTEESIDLQYLDIGPKTIKLYSEIIAQAKTVFWNGPMGVWEQPAFRDGTQQIARSIAQSKANTVIGGGDTIAAIDSFGLDHSFTYVSAAGGAALEFLSGKVLPAIKPLILNHNS